MPSGEIREATAACRDDDDKLISGGFEVSDSSINVIRSESDLTLRDVWRVEAFNPTDSSNDLFAAAICLEVTP